MKDNLIEFLDSLANGFESAYRDNNKLVKLTDRLAKEITQKCREQIEILKRRSEENGKEGKDL